MMFGGCELYSRPNPTRHTKTDGRDKLEFRFNSTFTLYPQEMITAESHLINVCLCVWGSTQATHKNMCLHANIHNHIKKILIALIKWTSWHFMDFCLLLITRGTYCRIIALSHFFFFFLTNSLSYSCFLRSTLKVNCYHFLHLEANLEIYSNGFILGLIETNGRHLKEYPLWKSSTLRLSCVSTAACFPWQSRKIWSFLHF